MPDKGAWVGSRRKCHAFLCCQTFIGSCAFPHMAPLLSSTEERIRAWIEQLGNPYVYLDGGVVVKLSFADKGETIEDRINSLYLAGA